LDLLGAGVSAGSSVSAGEDAIISMTTSVSGATTRAVVPFAIGRAMGFVDAMLKHVLGMGLSPVIRQQGCQAVFR
jgi:hypothetical protein